MELRFITQPFEDGTDLRDYLEAVAGDPQLTTLRIIVAWAKHSGVGRATDDLKNIRDRGGRVLAIVGVSEGGATNRGLRALIEQTDTAYVFHDSGRTFHSKVYLAEGPDHALLLVGSHNLTAGGFAWNYEAGVWCTLDLAVEEDRELCMDVVAYFNRLQADTDVCRPLTYESLAAILDDPALVIQDETARRAPRSTSTDAPEETDNTLHIREGEAETPAFGASRERKRALPPLPRVPATPPSKRLSPSEAALSGALTEFVERRWYNSSTRPRLNSLLEKGLSPPEIFAYRAKASI